jgi:hypothetical protein
LHLAARAVFAFAAIQRSATIGCRRPEGAS